MRDPDQISKTNKSFFFGVYYIFFWQQSTDVTYDSRERYVGTDPFAVGKRVRGRIVVDGRPMDGTAGRPSSPGSVVSSSCRLRENGSRFHENYHPAPLRVICHVIMKLLERSFPNRIKSKQTMSTKTFHHATHERMRRHGSVPPINQI